MKEVIDFKIGDEYKEGDILKTREGIYLLVEKPDNKHCVKCCYSCWFQNAPLDVCVQIDCTAGNFYFRPFETYQEGEEYNVGDLLKIPKLGELGKFILSIVVEDDCCSRNKCVDCLRDTNLDDIYYKPLAEVSE